MSLDEKNVVVTGGAGFIGSHLCEELIMNNVNKLIIIDDFSLGKNKNIQNIINRNNIIVYKLNASNYSEVSKILKKEKVDVTFNLAVIPLPASLTNPFKTVNKNILITSVLCELLRKNYYSTLIHVSSSEAYGTSVYDNKPMDENHPTYPTTPYAASKLACDHIALSYHKTFGLDIAIARPFNAYGPRQNEKSYAGVIPLTISRILKRESPVIYGDGLQTRDYTYVEDIANAIPKLYKIKAARGKIINLASGREITIKELIFKIMDIMDYTGPVIQAPPRPGDVHRHLGDISLAQKLIDYKPKTDLQEGLEKTITWYKQNYGTR